MSSVPLLFPDARVICSIQKGELHIEPASKEHKRQHSRSLIFGILRNCCSKRQPFSRRTLATHDILSAEHTETQIKIAYVRRRHRKHPVKRLILDCQAPQEIDSFVDSIWRLSYARGTKSRKRIKVLLNPFGGAGHAKAIWTNTVSPILAAAQYSVVVEETQHAGHAREIAETIQLLEFDAILCVSGDGLPHEVINGLGSRSDAPQALLMPIGFIPAGSGNGSAKSIYDSHDPIECALSFVKGRVTPIDLVYMTQGSQCFLSYFSLSFGVVADCDLGTEHLRWMGEARFTFGVLQRIFSRTCYPCTLSLCLVTDDKEQIRQDYHAWHPTGAIDTPDSAKNTKGARFNPKYGTVNDPLPTEWVTRSFPKMGTFYIGLMPYMSSTTCFFPTAVPGGGNMDVMHIQADLPFLKAVGTVAAVDTAKHFDSDYCYYAKCSAFRLSPEKDNGYISVDGEKVSFESIQGEIMPASARIITKNGQYFSQFQE